ncbi:MAG: TRAP transporter substrate-binding protein [Rhodobacter sp.]|nr:TRAP transporter substrate-binding protein [Paracoccaceae bacterium]MCC0072651.1 TRAP transporter substrate-binding protein [Rhodobacter sp.]
MFLDRNLRPLMVGITALALAGTAQAETVLTFNWWVPPTHLTRTEIMNPWAQAVSDATDGEVRIEFTATSLAPPPRQQELIDDGVVDLVMGVHGYTPDRFVNAGVMELPFMTTTGEQASIAYWRAYERFFAASHEHGDARVLAYFTHSPGTLMTRERVVDSIDDFQGLLTRGGGGTQDRVLELLGASVVSSPAPTTYELLANGVVDATLMTPDGYTSFNLKDLVQTQTLVPGGLFNTSFFVLMSQDAYDRIPEQYRAAFDALTGEYLSALGGRGFDTVSDSGLAQMRADGRTVVTADDAFVADLRDRLAPLETAWIEREQAERGIDGHAVIDFLRQQMADLASQ